MKTGRTVKKNEENWAKSKAKEAKATGKAYVSQSSKRVIPAKVMIVSKILWYIINL